jgi:hypothetical protein
LAALRQRFGHRWGPAAALMFGVRIHFSCSSISLWREVWREIMYP